MIFDGQCEHSSGTVVYWLDSVLHSLCIASAVKRVTIENLPKFSCLKMGAAVHCR